MSRRSWDYARDQKPSWLVAKDGCLATWLGNAKHTVLPVMLDIQPRRTLGEFIKVARLIVVLDGYAQSRFFDLRLGPSLAKNRTNP